jgi:hypothetical protein
MTAPLIVDLPHRLGAAEAKRRIASNLSGITGHLPPGADVRADWAGDRLDMEVGALGQAIAARIDVQEDKVRLEVVLPPALSFFRGLIEGAIRRKGADLLEDKSRS